MAARLCPPDSLANAGSALRTLIRNARAITPDEHDRILQEADVAIDGDRILAAGEIPERFADWTR